MESVNGPDDRSCTVDGAVGGPVAVGGPAVAIGSVGGHGGCETRRQKEQLDHVADCHPDGDRKPREKENT